MPAPIQHLGPKKLDRESGGHNEEWLMRQLLQGRKKVSPIPERQIPFGDDDRNRRVSQHGQGGSERVG